MDVSRVVGEASAPTRIIAENSSGESLVSEDGRDGGVVTIYLGDNLARDHIAVGNVVLGIGAVTVIAVDHTRVIVHG